jgi:cytochrome b involved in lipid metabolism
MSKTFSKDDVASHNKPDNLWVIIDEDVYDLTKFQDDHPGGKKSTSLSHARVEKLAAPALTVRT